jgi:hypothetical protein
MLRKHASVDISRPTRTEWNYHFDNAVRVTLCRSRTRYQDWQYKRS